VNDCRETRLRRLWRRVTRRKRCNTDLGLGGWDFPPDTGVREPRRPLPFAGAGALALPLDG
jgi:hypothetical protein